MFQNFKEAIHHVSKKIIIFQTKGLFYQHVNYTLHLKLFYEDIEK